MTTAELRTLETFVAVQQEANRLRAKAVAIVKAEKAEGRECLVFEGSPDPVLVKIHNEANPDGTLLIFASPPQPEPAKL